MAKTMPKALNTSARQKRLLVLLEDYIKSCRPPPEADAKKASGRLANLAGFCRFIGCGISHLQKLCSEVPRLYDLICTTLEDELLISSPSPSLLSYYLKKRLGYDEKEDMSDKFFDRYITGVMDIRKALPAKQAPIIDRYGLE